MKRRLLAIFLILALALAPAAQASQALGWELERTDTQLGPGVTLTTQTFWGDSVQDYRAEKYVTYTPGQGSVPMVRYGATVPAVTTVVGLGKALEGWAGRVLAGANGDYFVMSSGVPLGMIITGRVLRTSASYHYAVGFLPDGSAFVGKPEMTITASFSGGRLAVSGGYNKAREAQGGYTLFNPDFGGVTRASGEGINVVLRPVVVPEDYVAPVRPAAFEDPEPDQEADPAAWEAWSQAKAQREQEIDQWAQSLAASVAGFETQPAQLAVGGTLTCVVESVTRQSGGVAIPPDRLVLSIDAGGGAYLVQALAGLRAGERIDLSVSTPDARWSEVTEAIGAYQWILRDGAVVDGLEAGSAPRTALGIKPDGQVILYTIDGRQPGLSVGATQTQVAKRLLELGCAQGVLFDGGGSTTLGATGALESQFALLNSPSDGSQRAVTDALFFLSTLSATGVLGSLYIQPHSALMLSGARQSLSARGIDTGYFPLGEEPVPDVTYTAQGQGRIEGNVLVAQGETGTVTVTATAPGGVTGTATFNVVDTPHQITVTNTATGKAVTSLNLDPGQSVALSASSTWYKLPLQGDNSCYTWTVDPAAGTVDAMGVFTAGPRAASGTLTVAAGSKSVSIPVSVGGHVHALEDFEGEVPVLAGEGAQAACVTSQARLGYQSLEITYPQDGLSQLTWEQPVEQGESCLGFWHRGEGALALDFRLLLADGQTQTVRADLPAGADWQYCLLPIPETTTAIQGLELLPASDGAALTGTGRLYLDHFVTTNGNIRDTTAPTASLSREGGTLRAALSDNSDKTFAPERLALTLDGQRVDFTLEGNALTAALNVDDGKAHRVSLEIQDASGNRSRASLDIPGDPAAALPFTDIDDHWAKENIVYLAQQGVTNGRQVGDGSYIFDPQANITRGEFAAMLARWLRADLTGYEGAALPFADADQIPAWSRPAVAYLYETGTMAGSLEGDALYARSEAPITRAQAITMLGRVQAKGYEAQGETFTDDGDIPDWAREYVYTLVGQGVVSGYAGYVRPQASITRGEVAKLLTALR